MRLLAAVILPRWRSCLPGLLLLAGSGSCADSTAPRRELEDAKLRWERAAVPDYRMTVYHGCGECPSGYERPAIVTVRGGAVESRRYADGADVPANLATAFPDVRGLFAYVDDVIARGPDRLEVTYDAVYGFPSMIFVDYSSRYVDDEVFVGVADFVVL